MAALSNASVRVARLTLPTSLYRQCVMRLVVSLRNPPPNATLRTIEGDDRLVTPDSDAPSS
jgi:hypothetical protein